MRLCSLATLSTLLVLSLAAPATASPPASDRQRDAVGDVVRTYADGHVSTGRGRSDIRAVRMHSIDIGGVGTAVDVVARLTDIDRQMFQNHVHLMVRFTAGTGHVGRTVSDFTSRGTRYENGRFPRSRLRTLPASPGLPRKDRDLTPGRLLADREIGPGAREGPLRLHP